MRGSPACPVKRRRSILFLSGGIKFPGAAGLSTILLPGRAGYSVPRGVPPSHPDADEPQERRLPPRGQLQQPREIDTRDSKDTETGGKTRQKTLRRRAAPYYREPLSADDGDGAAPPSTRRRYAAHLAV